jgi:hypothetical protein
MIQTERETKLLPADSQGSAGRQRLSSFFQFYLVKEGRNPMKPQTTHRPDLEDL